MSQVMRLSDEHLQDMVLGDRTRERTPSQRQVELEAIPMKRILLFLLVIVFCATHTAKAQGRWMVGANGTVGLSAYAPRFLAGAETSFYLLDRPHFRLGPGIGFTVSGERYQVLTTAALRRGCYVPIFLRGEYDFPLGSFLQGQGH